MRKAFIDGKIVELTDEQKEEFDNIPVSQVVTDKQRISALESAIADLATMVIGGISND